MEHIRNPKHAVLIIILSCMTVMPVIFFQTTHSMVSTWLAEETFTHGFLIFPISIWLIWQKKELLSELRPQPENRVIPLFVVLLFGWLTGTAADVQLVQQFALIGMIITLIWLFLGRQLLLLLTFPLLFLFFSVPFGHSLIPPLMTFTAEFTVFMLQLTGIPVLQDGLYFTLPTGNWSVVEACSGLRYLIASFALGMIYAYINYRSAKKRLIFILFSLAVPIIANGFRAYGIVMLGHLSGMALATGVDHLIYGWIFFGIVIFLLFLAGSRWWDPPASVEEDLKVLHLPYTQAKEKSLVVPAALVAFFLVITLGYAHHLKDVNEISMAEIQLQSADSYGPWEKEDHQKPAWGLTLKNPDSTENVIYRKDMDWVQLSVAYYHHQRQGAEAVTSANRIASLHDGEWKRTHRNSQMLDRFSVIETHLRSGKEKLLVWHWYRIGDQETSSKYIAKAFDAYNKIITGRPDASMIAIATPLGDDIVKSRDSLRAFWSAAATLVKHKLDNLALSVEDSPQQKF